MFVDALFAAMLCAFMLADSPTYLTEAVTVNASAPQQLSCLAIIALPGVTNVIALIGALFSDDKNTTPSRPHSGLEPPRISRRGFLTAAISMATGFLVGRLYPACASAPGNQPSDPGLLYHTASKLPQDSVALIPGRGSPTVERDEPVPPVQAIHLPTEMSHGTLLLEDAIAARRSRRNLTGDPILLKELSRLLWSAAGITEPVAKLRASPSAGALYPIDIYLVANNIERIRPGIYRYVPMEHSLVAQIIGEFRTAVASAALGQQVIALASAVIVLVAVLERTQQKYGERAYRYVLLEAGHIAENLYLQATALGLGCCAVGAFFDDTLNRILRLDDKREVAVYLIAVGPVSSQQLGMQSDSCKTRL